MPRIGALGLVRPARLAIEAGELLHVRRGAVPADLEQVRFVGGGRDAGERAHLGVAELALRQRLGKERQVFECARDPDLLAGGMGVDAARPTEPVRARHRPLGGPQLATVELGDEDEQTPGGGVNMGGEGRDRRRKRVVVHAPGMVENGSPCVHHRRDSETVGEWMSLYNQILNRKIFSAIFFDYVRNPCIQKPRGECRHSPSRKPGVCHDTPPVISIVLRSFHAIRGILLRRNQTD